MEDQDLEPQRKAKPKRDLEPLSVADLEIYIGEMESEILRVREAIRAKQRQRGGAEALFKR